MDFCLLLKTWVKVATTDAIKTASKRAIQKTAEATGDLIGNKIVDKITSVSNKKCIKELHNNDEDMKITTFKENYISQEERQQIIDELMLKLKNIHISKRKTTNY